MLKYKTSSIQEKITNLLRQLHSSRRHQGHFAQANWRTQTYKKKFKVLRKLFCPDMKIYLPWFYMNSIKCLSYNIFFIWLSSLGKKTPLPEYKSIRFTMIFMHMNLQPKQENTYAWVQHNLQEINVSLHITLKPKYNTFYIRWKEQCCLGIFQPKYKEQLFLDAKHNFIWV